MLRAMGPSLRSSLALLATLLSAGCAAPPPDEGNASFQVRESVLQLQVTHAPAGAALALTDGSGQPVQSGVADAQGSLIFRHLDPGSGYVVRADALGQHSRPLRVMSAEESRPPQSFYSAQKLAPGFGYITTRDGTTLSVFVSLPGPPEMGPYPTVVNYSGYDPSRPQGPITQFEFLCDQIPVICAPPTDPSALLASLFGFATVSVNLRGTGCSGGAYDYFETLELLDGYDMIETVAAQDWVQFHKVGMTGLSYPGITQMFVAWTRPPSLAAITPLSVIGNTATTLLPGGILNSGFALEWLNQVLNRADPDGQGWEKGQIDAGDTVCAENQLLHSQKVDNIQEAMNTPYYVPALHDPLNPTFFAHAIDVPVFLAGSWQDEQTGPFFTTLLDQFAASPTVRFTVHNGVHEDNFAPQVLYEWKSFLDLFVARRVPFVDKEIRALAPLIFNQVFHSMLQLPPDRFTGFTAYGDALQSWMNEPRVRVIFDSGDVAGDPGAPVGTFERTFGEWPPAPTQEYRLYLQRPDGDGVSLADAPPADSGAASAFALDPSAGARGNLAGGDVGDKQPKWDWQQSQPGKAAVFESAPFATDMGFVGTGSADLWVKSTANDADLQITISELRPDGNETYVQSGWLRASMRKLGPDSTALWPSPTYLEADDAPLVPGQWTSARVPLAGFGHVFRKGSRIRLTVDTPGGTRAAWRFELKTFPGPVTHTIGHSAEHPSSLALPLIPGLTAPTPLPACPSLRGQPCRTAMPYQNTPG